MIEGKAPPTNIQPIWGDYNAFGLSDEEDDNCIYSLERTFFEEKEASEGMRVFVYMDDIGDDGEPEIFGYVCSLERIEGFVSEWRARPFQETWYRGPKTWEQMHVT